MLKMVEVTFGKSTKRYTYLTDLDLHVDAVYDIVADGRTSYSTPVTVRKIIRKFELSILPDDYNLRTISEAKLLSMPKRPETKIKSVLFNKEKGVTTVVWYDNQITMVTCHPEDDFDKEKALAMCFMKRVCGNRGSFNEELKKWCEDGVTK